MPAPRQHLPAPRTPFIGRERDVADLISLLHTVRMVTLTGSGGIGKTRLALRVAEQERSRFADGMLFVDLSAATAGDHVLYSIAQALGIETARGQSLHEAVLLALRSCELLLVLDTCDRIVAPLADLCRSLLRTCPRLRLLATSREPLRIPGENVWRVPPLDLPPAPPKAPVSVPWSPPSPGRLSVHEAMRSPALRLFAARAHQARPGFTITPETVDTVVQICRILDGVPLAIELAAARVQVLSVEQILQRLDDRFTLLNSTDQQLPERQRTMRAVVEWSHALLTDAEKALLRRLSIFTNWSLDMAEALFTADFGDNLLQLHASLLDKSLIVLEDEVEGIAYYRILDSVRVYAAEKLQAAGETEHYLRRALEQGVHWAGEFASAMGEDLPWQERLKLLNRVERNLDNMRSFLHRAATGDLVEPGLQVCVLLRSYWLAFDRCAEGAAFLSALLAAAPDQLPTPLRTRALVLYGELTLDLDGDQIVHERLTTGLRLAESLGDDTARAHALAALAVLALRQEEFSTGIAHATESLELARRLGDRLLEVHVMGVRSRLAEAAGDVDDAQQWLSRTLALSEQTGCGWALAYCHESLSAQALREGASQQAEEHLHRALTLFSELGSALGAARCLSALGRLAAQRGQSQTAWEHLSGAVRRSRLSGRRLTLARAMEDLAWFAASKNMTDRVVLLGAQAEMLRQWAHAPSPGSQRLREHVARQWGDASAAAAWTRARTLPLEEALDAALAAPHFGDVRTLTPRERQIARLAGSGLSNREIAARLVISQATVARHIANIFAKLNISKRAELPARLAALRKTQTDGHPQSADTSPCRS